CEELENDPPPLARIDALERTPAEAFDPALSSFEIHHSQGGLARTRVTPDARTCPACAAEIWDPTDRRHGYAFANCTHCGPRFSIVEAIPYDRSATTMAGFPLCPDCQAEYEDPADRRFHAQPIACPVCGPQLQLEIGGAPQTGDPVSGAVTLLRRGGILALKGLGGYQLACDARADSAVTLLRQRKQRPAKPFALMAGALEQIRRHALVSDAEAEALASPPAPILLLDACPDHGLAPSLAPGQWAHGWMLPTTPLHELLLDAFDGPLVMTSGNLSGEPQAIGDDEARTKLSGFADGFLLHNRPIARRLDDSVARMVGGTLRLQRRARGYAPETLPLPSGFDSAPPVTAYGAFLKSTLCLLRDGQAVLSHHLGDLSDALTAEEFEKADQDYAALLDHRPEVIACDLHPDYPSTATAELRAEALGVPLVRVQHHHAHIAAVMAENRWDATADGPVLGVVLDGLGYGDDGTVWGGELLLCQYDRYERLGALKPVPLPGGTAAQRDPWRNLLAQLDAAGLSDRADALLADKPLAPLRAAMAKGLNSPLTSSAGRLFDAMAAAVGCAPTSQSYEGEAAMALETQARPFLSQAEPYPLHWDGQHVDPTPLWQAVIQDLDAGIAPGLMAARFHVGLAAQLCARAQELATRSGAKSIALSGGCFQNATLLSLCLEALAGGAQRVLTHAATPPNDGCVALGQAVVAARQG
ncbi:MAG: carbamoyltransferase HypF, partial [Rhodospirillaceae bacterium]